jgi:hypothetical protein
VDTSSYVAAPDLKIRYQCVDGALVCAPSIFIADAICPTLIFPIVSIAPRRLSDWTVIDSAVQSRALQEPYSHHADVFDFMRLPAVVASPCQYILQLRDQQASYGLFIIFIPALLFSRRFERT